MVSDVDEDAVTAQSGTQSPRDTALLLARAKAEAVAALPAANGALVIGCDSIFEFDGEAHGKPYEPEVATARIRRMSGSSGVLHTGHWLVDKRHLVDTRNADDDGGQGRDGDDTRDGVGGREPGIGPASSTAIGSVASASVHFAELSEEEIAAYVATGEPLQCAGSFTIDGLGGAFITRVDGDPHAVVGLSISTLRQLLRSAGVGITELWAHT